MSEKAVSSITTKTFNEIIPSALAIATLQTPGTAVRNTMKKSGGENIPVRMAENIHPSFPAGNQCACSARSVRGWKRGEGWGTEKARDSLNSL
ncbi:MAG: hypothetical protein ACFCUR_02040 [Rhodomicrobiaceae bacterium]